MNYPTTWPHFFTATFLNWNHLLKEDEYKKIIIRKFSVGSEYRYGFNGQEKTPEVKENSTTAEFWQYDARLGRRWNIDPNPVVGLSIYATFFNNPIYINDIKGDTGQVSVKLPTTANPNHTEMYKWYKGASGTGFYDEKGVALIDYDALVKIHPDNQFLKDVNAAMIRMYITKPGEALINELNNPALANFTISKASAGNSTNTAGGGVQWSTANITGGYDEKGKTTRPSYIGLGHELKHQLHVLNGTVDLKETWVTQDDNGNPLTGITNDEILTTHLENQLRAACGIPLRTHYSYDAAGVPVETTRLIKNGTRESIYVDKNGTTTKQKVTSPGVPFSYPK